MNQVMLRSVVVIALRHVAPLLGGAGVVSEGELQQIAGAVILLGSIGYHVYQRYTAKQAQGETVKIAG